jgi:hypothetical protein
MKIPQGHPSLSTTPILLSCGLLLMAHNFQQGRTIKAGVGHGDADAMLRYVRKARVLIYIIEKMQIDVL